MNNTVMAGRMRLISLASSSPVMTRMTRSVNNRWRARDGRAQAGAPCRDPHVRRAVQHAVSNLALWKESDSRGSVDAMGYSRPQLTLLLLLAAIALTGLGVREWRAGFPDAAERLDRFDREDPPPPIPLVRPRALPGWSPARVEAAAPPRPAPRERASEAKPAATAPADPRSLDLNRASVEHREG